MTSDQLLLLKSAHALITGALPGSNKDPDRSWLLDILDELATFIETAGLEDREELDSKNALA